MDFASFKRALLISAIASTAAVGSAQAQATFSPVSSWQLSSISATAPKICGLSNQFDNGFKMDIRGTESAINSMVVNFRQDVFQMGQSYEVSLSVPGKPAQGLEGQAFSKDALTINLANNRQFFLDMGNAGVLDMAVEGNNFRFQMGDLAKATGAFNGCVTNHAPVMATTTPQNLVKTETADAQITVSEVKVEPAPAPVVMAAAPTAPDALPTNDYISGVITTDQFKTRKTTAGERRISEVLADQLGGALVPNERKFNHALPKVAMAAPVNTVEPEAPKKALPPPSVIEVKEPPQEELGGVFIPETKEVKPTAISRAKPIIPSEEPPVRSSEMEQHLQHGMAKMESDLAMIKKENAELRKELQMALSESKEETASISSNNWDLERATMRYNEAERQIDRLGRQVQKERARCSAQLKELEAMLFDPKVTETEQLARLAELEDQLADAQEELARERLKYEERISILERQLNSQ